MARFKAGVDIWQCDCEAVNIMGRPCYQCGKTYADILTAKAKAEKRDQRPQKRGKRYREPSRQGSFITSFLFKNEKK